MGNSARRLAVGAPEQMTMSGAGTSSTPGETSSFHTALEECLPSRHDIALGDSCGEGSSMDQKSEYFSVRVEEMMRSKSLFSSDVEHEIEHSRVHWSEVTGLSDSSEDNEEDEDNDHEEVSRENREVFAELMNDPQWSHDERDHPFFGDWPYFWKSVGRKIAEGGQAAIFEIIEEDGDVSDVSLLKVFKRRSRLSHLKKQWPHGIFQLKDPICNTFKALMLDDGRFAFAMSRCWGDLRKLIDQAMQEKNNQGPPFPYVWNGETFLARDILGDIAAHMAFIHEQGIQHRDLKASNILLPKDNLFLKVMAADFESSIGVVGTRFWRAPEILLALKNRSALDFSEKADVYSYSMICFEVLTGRLPLEGELEACRASNDLIIEGRRPKLPSDLDLRWKYLIKKCWNSIPNKRPSFQKIISIQVMLFDLVPF